MGRSNGRSDGRMQAPQRSDGEVYNELAIRNNCDIVEYCRTALSIVAGCTAGILGLTGFSGFGFYILASMLMTVILLVKAGSQWRKYFLSRRSLWWDGLLGGIFTYILFWTFLYGMVHVY